MTTGLSDKQLHAAFEIHAWPMYSRKAVAVGLRAVADLAITHLEADNHHLATELQRVRVELTILQRK